MRFLSTRKSSSPVSLAAALRLGLPADGGLFMPERLTAMSPARLRRLAGAEASVVGEAVLGHLLSDDLPAPILANLAAEALNFPLPLHRLEPRLLVLELFHGPTLAFKDVGARFLARLLAATDDGTGGDRPLTVVVATSGDTGGAVARAFHGVAGTQVAILYPDGQVSPLQERQLATLGNNIRAFAVDGTFDDCQRLVKRAFAEPGLRQELRLTSANSINVGRLLPQIIYYFVAVAQLSATEAGRKRLFVVPSGNFGNLTAGLMAQRLGLGVDHFVAATNTNDVVPCYLDSGRFEPRAAQRTISNAMDVGNPSNFDRILHLYDSDWQAIRHDVSGSRHDDEATRQTILEVERKHHYLLDPHTAVGYQAARHALSQAPTDTLAIVLATAHPAKFGEIVEPLIGRPVELPPALAERLGLPLSKEPMANHFPTLKERLLNW